MHPEQQRGEGVGVGHDHERDAGLDGHQREASGRQEEREIRAAPADVDRLHAAEADRAHHQQAGHEHHRERRQRQPPVLESAGIAVHGRRDDAGGRGARHAGEIALVGGRVRLDVEPRQPHGRGGDVEEADRPAHASERPEAPRERQDRGRHAERHDVGERIELDAESRRGIGEARDEAVERVEHHRDADQQRRRVEVAARSRRRRHAYPQNRLATVSSDGSRKTPRLNRRGRSVFRRRSGAYRAPVAPQGREHGLAADDLSPTLHPHSASARQEDVHARPELHQADPLAARELLPFHHAADDAAGEHADDLADNDRAGRCGPSRSRSARCRWSASS